jgi:hypothetical protein
MPLAATILTFSTGHGCWPATLPLGPVSLKTFINGLPVPLALHTIYMTHICLIPHAGAARLVFKGSLKVFIEGKMAVRFLDPIVCGDKVGPLCSPKVNIGG